MNARTIQHVALVLQRELEAKTPRPKDDENEIGPTVVLMRSILDDIVQGTADALKKLVAVGTVARDLDILSPPTLECLFKDVGGLPPKESAEPSQAA